MINTTGNAVDRTIFSLDQENKEVDEVLTENFQDTTLPTTFESTEVKQGSDGRWLESQKTNAQPGKKSKQIRDDRLAKDEQDVQNYKDLASISDSDLYNKVTQINEKKNQIITLINDAIGIGCSSGITTSPGYIGITSFVTTDSAKVKKYQFDDYSTANPFVSSTANLSSSNIGDGYKTTFTINGGSDVGSYKTITYNALHQIIPNGETICSGYASSITTLISEIQTLQSQVDQDLISDTNTLKNKKIDSELFVWGQKRQKTKLQQQKTENNNIKTLVTDLSSRIDSNPENLLVHLDANNSDSYGGTGTVWYDLQGNRNGILKYAHQWNAIGYMNYTGNNDIETLIEEVPINTSLGITVEMILNATYITPDHTAFCFYDVDLGLWFGYGKFGFFSNSSAPNPPGDTYGFNNAYDIFYNKWVHCVAYFPPNWSASTYTNAKIWINGSNKNLSLLTGSGPVQTRTLNSSQNMSIGGGLASGTNDQYNWYGNIALTKIYNKELTDAEVLTKYNAVKDLYLDMP